jgi:hypothetical protein
MPEILSKSAYAARRGRGPSSVSNWIRGGQLSPPALRSDGKIDAAAADAQLAQRVNPVRAAAAVITRQPVVPAANEAPASWQDKYFRARAQSAAIRAERERRELNAERGRYVLAEKAREEFARGIMEHLMSVEQSLPDLADRLGVGVGGLIELRRWWRQQRVNTAERNRVEASKFPEYMEDPADERG